MSDLISRQAAIDIVVFECGKWTGLAKEICKQIKQLPSAEPETNCSEFPNNSDTISRQAVIDAFDCTNELIVCGEANAQNVVNYINKVVGKIKDLPSAQPEIIRCKECKHWDTSWQNDYAPNYHYCPLVDGTRRDDFYCADAERRTDE